MRNLVLACCSTLAAAAATSGQETPTGDLQKNLADDAVEAPWIYDDIEAGFAAARSSRRPLLVSFRCVP